MRPRRASRTSGSRVTQSQRVHDQPRGHDARERDDDRQRSKGVISITIEEVEGATCAIHARAGLDEELGVYERLEYCSAHEWFHVPEAAGFGLR